MYIAEAYKQSNSYMIKQTWYAAMNSGHRFNCGICGQAITPKGELNDSGSWCLGYLTVDHIVPRAQGGTDDLMNLQPAHFRCNAIKGHNTNEYEVQAAIHAYQYDILDAGYQKYLGKRLRTWIYA